MVDAVPAQTEIATLQAEKLRLEVRSLTESAWGDVVYRDDYFQTPGDTLTGGFSGSRPVYATSLEDRADGRFRPVYECEQDLALSRAAARNLVIATPIRTGALETLANYTLGKGYTFKVEAEDETQRQSLILAKAVQDVIDRFIDENDFCGVVDREIHHRSREDGECLIAFDEEEIYKGRVLVEFIEPDQLTEPANPYQLEEWIASEFPGCSTGNPECWKFGVHTPARKTWKTLGYHIVRDGIGADWDYIPATRVEHIKRNVTRNAKRGVTDFFEILSDLQDESKLAGNMSKGAALQAAIAWILQTPPGSTQASVQSVGGADRIQYNKPSVFGPGGQSSTRNAAHYPAGTILKVPATQEYLAGPMGAERNAGFEVVGQYALRRIGVRWVMPEYMISGDASNNNRASSETAESPFVRAREADQQFYKRHFLSLLWKVVRIHVESGRFAKFGIHRDHFDVLTRLIDIGAECPTVASRNGKESIDGDKILVDGGVMSKQTWAARNELDWVKEQKLGAKEAPPPPSPFGGPGAVGPDGKPMPPKPGLNQPAEPPEPGGQDVGVADQTKQAAVQGALESVQTTDEAKAILETLYP